MPILIDFAKVILLVIAAGVSIGLLFTVLHIGKERWREAGKLTGSFKGALQGEVEADRNGLRDPRVAKGKVWDKATKNWRRQGKLSDEYVKSAVS